MVRRIATWYDILFMMASNKTFRRVALESKVRLRYYTGATQSTTTKYDTRYNTGYDTMCNKTYHTEYNKVQTRYNKT